MLDLEPTLRFVVYGEAKPAGSKRGFRIPGTDRISITDANPKSRPWKLAVAQIAGWEMDKVGVGLLDGPLSVLFRFVVVRPKGHFKKGGELSAKGRREPHPAKRPDLLKLARGIEDALSKVVYRDDSQIVDERLVKEYGGNARVEIEIVELDASPILAPSENLPLEF